MMFVTGRRTIGEVRDGSGDPKEGPGWVGGPLGRSGTGRGFLRWFGTGRGPSRSSGTGRETLREVRAGSGHP